MPTKAPRPPACLWQDWARGARLALCVWLAATGFASADETITSARFTDPTTRYAHGVLGDDIEYGTLEITVNNTAPPVTLHDRQAYKSINPVYKQSVLTIRLPEDRVFEDLNPRLIDIDQNGTFEVIVVESQKDTGAQLAIYSARGQKVAATPHIGTRFRWLAPVGAADLDGDGHVEIAYIDRPHLAKTLRIWRFKDGTLTEIASLPDLTNHRIGEDYISGGLHKCSDRPEMILVNGNWSRIISVSYQDGWIKTDLGPYTGRNSLNRAVKC